MAFAIHLEPYVSFKFQEQIGKPLLWLPCRHLSAEVILKHMFLFDALDFEPSVGPEIKIFSRFRTTFQSRSTANNPQLVSRELDLLQKLKCLKTMKQVRDDYLLEFVDLANLLLERGDSYSSEYQFKACGAIHKAQGGWQKPSTQ